MRSSNLPWYFHHDICFYDIQLLHLVKAFEYETTLISGLNFLHIILESLQGSQVAFEDLLALTGDTNLTASLEHTVQNIGTCDVTDSGCLEDLTNLCMTDNLLLVYGIQHTLHGSFHILDSLVDDLVQTYIHALSLRLPWQSHRDER